MGTISVVVLKTKLPILCIVGSIATSDRACLNALVVVRRCHLPIWILHCPILSMSILHSAVTTNPGLNAPLRVCRPFAPEEAT